MKWQQFAERQPTLSTGLLYGAGLGVVVLVLDFISNLIGTGKGPLQTAMLWITIVIVGGTYIRASWITANRTNRISTGTITGMITGCIAYFINLLGHMLVLPFYLNQLHASSHLSTSAIFSAAFVTLLYWIAFFGLLGGVVAGCIGGNIGIHRAPRPILATRTSNTKSD